MSEEIKAKGAISANSNKQKLNFMEVTMNNREIAEKANEASVQETSDMRMEILDVESLVVPSHHPRKNIGNLETLQNSIRRDGLQEPLLVSEAGENKFEVIDGTRRFEVVKEFGWKEVSCLIRKGMDASNTAHLSYVKNVERNSLSAIEIASHIKTMMDEFGYTLREMELKGYGSPSTISNKLKLIELSDKIQQQIENGNLTATHGLALIKLNTTEEQERMAKRIVDFDLTGRKTEDQINRYLAKKKNKKKKDPKEIIPSTDVPGVYFKDAKDMSEFPDKSVHLIVSSPPYNVGMEFEIGISLDEHLENIKAVMSECARVLVPGGIMALNVADIVFFRGKNGESDQAQIKLMGNHYQSFLKRGKVFLTDEIIWSKRPAWRKDRYGTYKTDTVHTSYRIFDNWEPVYIFRKKGERDIPSGDIELKSKLTREQWMAWIPGVWDIEPTRNNEGHPCVYPDELVQRLVRMFSYFGDTVLDPFLGSGTTVKVARELGRHGIGYERELQYKPVIMEKFGVVADEGISVESDETVLKVRAEDVEVVEAEGEAFRKTMDAVSEAFGASENDPEVDAENPEVISESVEETLEAGVPA